MGGGLIAALLTCLLWRSQRLVFLDRICINQHDDDLKRQSIYSLGGIIGQAQEMLVLWDSTWSDRRQKLYWGLLGLAWMMKLQWNKKLK